MKLIKIIWLFANCFMSIKVVHGFCQKSVQVKESGKGVFENVATAASCSPTDIACLASYNEYVFAKSDSDSECNDHSLKRKDFEWPIIQRADERWPSVADRQLWQAFWDKNLGRFVQTLKISNNPNALNPSIYQRLSFNHKYGNYSLPKYDSSHPALTIMHAIASCPVLQIDEQTKKFYCAVLQALAEVGANFNIPLKRYYINLNVAHENERTPLHYACQQGIEDIVVGLLIGNADPAIGDSRSISSVHIAAEQDHAHLLDIFFDSSKNPVELLSLETDISDGYRLPIHYAARQGSARALTVILERANKCNVAQLTEERDILGQTPLHDAVRHCENPRDVIDILLKYGANPNAQDNLGQTPLHALVQGLFSKNKCHAAELLLKNGANRNLRNKNNQTPEMFLCTKYVQFRKFLWRQFFKKFDSKCFTDFGQEA